MNDIEYVGSLRKGMQDAGKSKPEIVAALAGACLGWPYVFGAWGEECTPTNRKRRKRDDHPTIVSKCQVLNGSKPDCTGCKWGIGVRMFDCRGFTHWLLEQVGIDIKGQGATSQYNTASNWVQKGPIAGMPDVVCCVFKQKDGKMEHTGMHVGGGKVIHCSSNVQTGKTTDRGWTHYAIPYGLYDKIPEEPIVVKRTLKKGSRGEDVKELQKLLNDKGYSCGNADGIFGDKTKKAVEAFQEHEGLTVDGICGPQTWSALQTSLPVEQDTYRVTIENVTWDQYREILKICPLAECTKE